jgi:hypothetical protein
MNLPRQDEPRSVISGTSVRSVTRGGHRSPRHDQPPRDLIAVAPQTEQIDPGRPVVRIDGERLLAAGSGPERGQAETKATAGVEDLDPDGRRRRCS